jgi:hypothetical protein
MQIKDVYKQPLILCRNCNGRLGYQSFIIEEDKEIAKLSTMTGINVEELIPGCPNYLPVSCTICDSSLGLKYVKF